MALCDKNVTFSSRDKSMAMDFGGILTDAVYIYP